MNSKKAFLFIGLMLVVLIMTDSTLLFAQEDTQKHQSCGYCGMNRGQYAHSRMLIVYDDGTEVGTCSIHCAAVDLGINLDKTPKNIHVGDYNTKKLIDAEKAVWVIGGEKPGVMSKRAKWAFEKEADARVFMKTNGGTIATFDDAIKAAYEDMYADTKMIRERRKMKKMQMPVPAGQKQ
jgi:copper chaperone NosL